MSSLIFRSRAWMESATWGAGDDGKSRTFTPAMGETSGVWQVRVVNAVDDTVNLTIVTVDEDGDEVTVAGFDAFEVAGDEGHEWRIETQNPSLKVTVDEVAGSLGTSGNFVVKIKAWPKFDILDDVDSYTNTAL